MTSLNMIKKISSLSLLVMNTFAYAATPVITFAPVAGYPPVIDVSNGGAGTIKYVVTNQSRRTHTFSMEPMVGITQNVDGSGTCSNPMILAYHQSCTLVLNVSGSSIVQARIGGPKLCVQGNLLQCYQPSQADSIKIQKSLGRGSPIKATPQILTLQANGPAQNITVTNKRPRRTLRNIRATLPANWTDVSQNATNCASVAPNQSCTIVLTPGSSAHPSATITIQGNNTLATSINASVVPQDTTALSMSLSAIAVSVYAPNVNPALTGNTRELVITNTGANPANNITATTTPASSAAAINTANCTSLSSGASCTITIVPDHSIAAMPTTTPITLTAQATNSNSLTSEISVLAYESIYQNGYVFAIDDTTPVTSSVGGTVASLVNQVIPNTAKPPGPGIIWSSNGQSGTPPDAVYDAIPGIYRDSTPPESACDGASDGDCNTNVIVDYYPAVNPDYYAAGRCLVEISGYSDWYLPAICELGLGLGLPCGSNPQDIATNLSNLTGCSEPYCNNGYYWSSTESSSTSNNYQRAWFRGFFKDHGGSYPLDKGSPQGVRCVRALD